MAHQRAAQLRLTRVAPEAWTAEQLRLTRLRLLERDRELQGMLVGNSWWITQPVRAAERSWPVVAPRALYALKLIAWAVTGQLPARLRGRRAIRAAQDPPVAPVPPGPPPAIPDGPAGRRVLIVDEQVPLPDRDAGSGATMGVIETLLAEGWVVTFWPHDRRHAGRYTMALEALGVAVVDAREPSMFAPWLAANAASFDHIMLMRPRPAAALVADVLRHGRARITYYGHDIHGLRLQREAALRRDAFLAEAAERELAAERQLWRVVDVVLYLSPHETSFVCASEPGVTARTVPGFTFASFPDVPAPPATTEVLFVGNFAHAPNQDAALWFAGAVLPLVLAAEPNVRLVLAGAQPTPAMQALAGVHVKIAGWLDDADLATRYAAARVVVAPLRFGAGVKGKVAEALQLGRPLVATSVAAEGLPDLAEIVPVADDPAALAAAIVRLLADDAAWAAQAAAQIAYARAHCSRAALRTALLAALPPTGDGP